VVVRSLRLLPDARGGIIIPQVSCDSKISINDAEASDYMLALYERLKSVRTLPANVSIIDIGKDIEPPQPNQPLHPDALTRAGERRR